MRNLCIICIAVGLLGVAGGAYANIDYNLWTLAGHNPSGTVTVGSYIDLLVQMDTDVHITSVYLKIDLPMEGWTRNWYELSDYSWFEEPVENAFPQHDFSKPNGATVSRVIMNNSYDYGLDPNTPDFCLNTDFNPLSSWATGNDVNIGAFRLTIPTGTPLTTYNIGLRRATGTDWENLEEFAVQDSNFSLTVTDPGTPDIPEPGTAALMGFGLAALVGLRRRRRSE
jgi:hypothetical protein